MAGRLAALSLVIPLAAACGTSHPHGRAQPAAAPATTVTTSTPTTTAGGCAPARPAPSGQRTVSLGFSGVTRNYLVYVPSAYRGDRAVPALFEFHGYGSNAAQQLVYGDFRPLADQNDFIIVAPNGQGAEPHFNLTAPAGQPDDVAFTLAVLDRVESDYCVDTRRVFATGMSDGGAMTSVLACRAADRFAAFGPVAVELYVAGCAPDRPIPIAAFHGTSDPVVPFNGGTVSCCGNPQIPSAPVAMAGWAQHNGCSTAYVDEPLSSEVVERHWTGCRPNGEVRFYMIQGGGHTWPGSAVTLGSLGLTTRQISATDTLWAFFQAHPLPG